MQNVVINMCENFRNDRLRKDRASGNGKSDNNKKKRKNNVCSAWRPVSGSKNDAVVPTFMAKIKSVIVRAVLEKKTTATRRCRGTETSISFYSLGVVRGSHAAALTHR